MNVQILTLYGIANCDTIKKTRQWLADRQIPYTFHDYKKQGIDAALAEQMLQAMTTEKLINRRGTTWRKLPAQTQEDVDKGNAAAVMLAYPSVIKRPLLTNGQQWMVGYDEECLAAFVRNSATN